MQIGQWIIGVGTAPLYTLADVRPSPVDALSYGIMQSLTILKRTASELAKSVLGREDVRALDGPIAIGRVTGQAIQLGPVSFFDIHRRYLAWPGSSQSVVDPNSRWRAPLAARPGVSNRPARWEARPSRPVDFIGRERIDENFQVFAHALHEELNAP